jgi:electron transport complex protein RnfG
MSPERSVAIRSRPLLVIALVIIASIAGWFTSHMTHERIERNRQAWFTSQLQAVLAPTRYDNDPLHDKMSLVAAELGTSQPLPAYIARQKNTSVAVAITAVAPDGYRGPLTLLIGVDRDERVLGLRVLEHEETPGLGDAFANREPHWLDAFKGRSLQSPQQSKWSVRKDGGEFDQFTGATVTPRAIVKAARNALEYVHSHHDQLFGPP